MWTLQTAGALESFNSRIRMQARTAMIVIALTCGSGVLAEDKWSGRYRHVSLDGYGGQEGCEFVWLAERRVELNAISPPGSYEGFWITTRMQWMSAANGPTCAVPDAKAGEAGQKIINYLITAKVKGDKLQVFLHSSRCVGDWCDQATEQELADAESTFELKDGRLVDTNNTPETDDDIILLRLSNYQDQIERLTPRAIELARPIGHGECESAWGNLATSLMTQVDRSAWISHCKKIFQFSGGFKSRTPQVSWLATAAPSEIPNNTPYFIVSHAVRDAHRRQGAEWMILTRESGEWKVLYYAIR